MATPLPAFRPAAGNHLHVAGEVCPYCEQPIPNDKAQEIQARFEAKERERAEAMKVRLNEQFAKERVLIETNARAAVEKAQQDSAAAIEKTKADAMAQQAAAREEGRKTAEAAAQEKIDTLSQANAALQATTTEQLAESQRQKNAAVTQYEMLKANQENALNQRTHEVREAMEKDKTAALHAKEAKHFEETQKFTGKLAELQRQLEKKSNDELGEGAEIELFEALKMEFDGDKIDRYGKGAQGADIQHVVIHNGKECGIIVYDSKDRGAWRNDYVDKLAKDQRAARAEHAILSTRKFPAERSQLYIDDGIIIANPARVVAIVQLIRKHIVHVHSMRLSGTERAKKTAALYDFITSKRCLQLLDSIDTHAEDLLKLQQKEVKAHETNWKQQGTLYRSIQKSRAGLGLEIDRIIGAADPE